MISVIVPSRSEGDRLRATIARLCEHDGSIPLAGDAEVVVAAHAEPESVRAHALRHMRLTWVDCPRPCRGEQLARGADAARGEILLFLHADTRLPNGALQMIATALAHPGVVGGGFHLRFDARHPALALLERLSGLSWRTAFLGDQGFFCRRSDYEAAGGFATQPLFEDVDLALRLARRGRLVRLPGRVTTSARRFVAHGPWRQLALNTWLMLRHYTGQSPVEAARGYRP